MLEWRGGDFVPTLDSIVLLTTPLDLRGNRGPTSLESLDTRISDLVFHQQQVTQEENDGKKLFSQLLKTGDAKDIARIFASLEGPYVSRWSSVLGI
jgi:hypothetical protein